MRVLPFSPRSLIVAGILLAGAGTLPVLHAGNRKVDVSKIYGRIQIVNSFPDYRVQVVSAFPDLRVQKVNAFPDRAGRWQIVDSFPDFKIQIVQAFPDFKIQFVDSFPGPVGKSGRKNAQSDRGVAGKIH